MSSHCYKLLALFIMFLWGLGTEASAQALPVTLGVGDKIEGPNGRTYTFDSLSLGMQAGTQMVTGTLTVPGYKNGQFTCFYDPGLSAPNRQDLIISSSIETQAGDVICLPNAYGHFKRQGTGAMAVVVAVLITSDPTGNLEQGETTYTYDPAEDR